MAAINKKVIERFGKTLSKFQKVLKIAYSRDLNEADTVTIIQDILHEVLNYDKYLEITSEYAIRNTYCDLGIKIQDKIQFLIEVKSIGTKLKDDHIKQAVDYGANHGAQWVILTNGIDWELYTIKFEKPISHELVSSFNFLELNPRKIEDQEILYVLSKEGLSKSAREIYYERTLCINRHVISAILLSTPSITLIKKHLRKLSSGIRIEDSEIEDILKNDIIKRDVFEDNNLTKIIAKLKRLNKTESKKAKKKEVVEIKKEDSEIEV